MPYYDETLTEDQLKRMADGYRCNECGGRLNVAWGGYFGIEGYVLRCSDAEHSTIAPKRTAIKGKETYQEKIWREMELEQKHGLETSRALETIPKQGQLTEPQAIRILELIYPGAPKDAIIRCAIFCQDYGLHPLAKEVYLIPFNKKDGDGRVIGTEWSMVVGIAANRKIAHNLKGSFSFLEDTPRAATDEEIKKQFGKDSGEAKSNLISITKLQGQGGNLAIGFGLYPKSGKPKGMDKGNTQRNMSNIRSERQGMDRLPGKPMPQVEVIDVAYEEVPEIGKVDTTTGEILDGKVLKVPEQQEEQAAAAGPEEEEDLFPKPEQPPVGGLDMDWLKEAMAKIKWTDKTATSFIKSKTEFKGIDVEGRLAEVLTRMSKEQQGQFVAMVQELESLA